MDELKKALFEKEKGKKSDRSVLFPGGKGRHLTAPEVIAQKRTLKNAKVQEVTDKANKKAKKEARKAEKERLEVEWKEMLVKHAAEVDLKATGTKAKELPKRPKRPLKPKPKGSDEEEDNTSGEDESDEE
ncbi:hypothetical protein B0H13DRAFT_1859311 [Mycena leptocephala]|nr:hypothetical protein B0H13DRAFT_1859311 [Mycena leptocephala]